MSNVIIYNTLKQEYIDFPECDSFQSMLQKASDIVRKTVDTGDIYTKELSMVFANIPLPISECQDDTLKDFCQLQTAFLASKYDRNKYIYQDSREHHICGFPKVEFGDDRHDVEIAITKCGHLNCCHHR